jgi:hypothetical protein
MCFPLRVGVSLTIIRDGIILPFFSPVCSPPPFLDSYIPPTSRDAENLLSKIVECQLPTIHGLLESAMSFGDGLPVLCFWAEEVIRYIGEVFWGDEPNVIIKWHVSWCSLLLSALFRLQTFLFSTVCVIQKYNWSVELVYKLFSRYILYIYSLVRLEGCTSRRNTTLEPPLFIPRSRCDWIMTTHRKCTGSYIKSLQH